MAERPRQATSISCQACAHGRVHIDLSDKDGVFATATLSAGQALDFTESMAEVTDLALEVDTIHGCAGSA